MDWPETLTINAWTGPAGQPSGSVSKEARKWAVRLQAEKVPKALPLAADEPADPREWQNEEVGWGLVLPENEQIPEAERAVAADAPAPIQELLASRPGSPVFRCRPELHYRSLRRYYADRPFQDIEVSGGVRGRGVGRLPWYLLLCGSPEVLPWRLQYVLNSAAYVGRLDLDETGLDNYVRALLGGWKDAASRPDRPVVWTVDHGHPDITWLMRQAIAEPLAAKLRADAQIGEEHVRCLAGPEATTGALVDTLTGARPAFVVTTSHGMTGPLDDPATMGRQLGFLVDDGHDLLGPEDLLEKWQPDGAIWYAHACCSAGSDKTTSYEGLVEEGTSVDLTLKAVAGLGSKQAPLPRALLGAERPLRAFIGHVEPTFDWTLRADTGQLLTATLRQALYNRMYRKTPEPVGLAFQGWYRHVGELLSQWKQAFDAINDGDTSARAAALRAQLTALDRQSLVILGDPTVALPPLG